MSFRSRVKLVSISHRAADCEPRAFGLGVNHPSHHTVLPLLIHFGDTLNQTPSGSARCREISAESERESQQLQNHWSEVRYLVRCIYRQTGTPLGEDHDQPLDRDKEGMKELVDR